MSKNVLIVDDSMFMRTMINDALVGAGYNVVGQAGDGETAIEMALELKPDIITLDNILPDMIGLDILRILLKEEELDTKVVMISAVGQDSAINEGKSLGAKDYIVKPFTSDDLIEKINNACLV